MTVPAEDPEVRRFAPDFLTELFRNPLDPGYADAAARRARDGGPTGWSKRFVTAASVVTLVALGFLLVVAYRQTVAEEPARTQARTTLVQQVQKRRADTDRLQQHADDVRAQVVALRERELGGSAVARLRNLEAATGLAPVRGDGARITLGDGATTINPVTGLRSTDGRVKDIDLQLAANALWASGAEAIAVNGQRLTSTTTIRQAGEAILVDLAPVTTPYRVEAIGPDKLAGRFRDGYAGRFFRQLVARYGMSFDVASVNDLTLPAATEPTLRFASTPPAPSASPSVSSPLSAAPSASAHPRGTPSEGGR